VHPRPAAAALISLLTVACAADGLTLPQDPPESLRIVRQTPSPSDVGRAVLFVVELGSGRGGGAHANPIEIRASTGEGCTGNDRDLQCEIVFASPGTRTVTAHYPGDETYEAEVSDPVTHVVNEVAFPTRTILGVGPDPSPAGAAVTVWITVRAEGGAPAQGRVEVYGPGTTACGDGPHAGGTELNANGQATITVRDLPEGWHYFRGCFLGSPGFSPSEDGASVTIE
jgi:hypothetical protein